MVHRSKVRNEQAVYFIQGEKGVFVIKVLFLASENTSSAVVEPMLEEEISGDHVLKEINAVVEGNRTLTMKAIGKNVRIWIYGDFVRLTYMKEVPKYR